MPLHLLGKKSWHVYNADNVARVRRDEADAQAREEAAEQEMQAIDAQRRTALLRGEQPPPLPASNEDNIGAADGRDNVRDRAAQPPRKRRRLRGEDETDAQMRFAQEDAAAAADARERLPLLVPRDRSDAPLVGPDGHLQLVFAPDEREAVREARRAEAEARKSGRKGEEKDGEQLGMRFRDAAGGRHGVVQPWYADAAAASRRESAEIGGKALVLADVQDKDVWGNADPRRKERESRRIVSSDPFAAMQQAQRQLKQSERDRDSWKRKRLAELEEEDKERRRHKASRRRREDRAHADAGLEGFSLDALPREERTRRHPDEQRDRRHRHHSHRHRSGGRTSSHERRRQPVDVASS